MAVELITLGSVIRDALDTTLGHSNWQVDVTGDGYITVTGTPSSNQLAVFSDPTTVQGVSGLTWDGTEFTITGDLDVTANSSIGGSFVVTGSTTLNDSLVVSTNTTIGGDLVASGNITAGGDLAVGGILSVNGLATFTDNVVMGSSLNISNNLSIAGNITAGGDLAVSGAFNATDVALFDADVTLLANLDVSGDITVDGTVDGVDIAQLANDVAALANGMVYAGNWDASGGSFPGAGGAQTGAFYTVSVSGTVDGESFEAGDRLIAITDNASTTTFAGNWTRIDATDAVQSVAGLVGTITDTALRTALNVEDGATADMTGAEIEALLDAELGGTSWKTGGSIVPIQDDGVEIVAAPSDLNFTGAGVTVTDVGGVATIAIPGGSGTVDVVSNVAQDTILGRTSSGSGDSEELTPAQVRTLLNVEDGATADQTGAEIVSAIDTELGGSTWQSGGAGSVALDDLTDVDLTTSAPTDGQALIFDNASGNWIPGDVAASSGGSSGGSDIRAESNIALASNVFESTGLDLSSKDGVRIFLDRVDVSADQAALALTLYIDGAEITTGYDFYCHTRSMNTGTTEHFQAQGGSGSSAQITGSGSGWGIGALEADIGGYIDLYGIADGEWKYGRAVITYTGDTGTTIAATTDFRLRNAGELTGWKLAGDGATIDAGTCREQLLEAEVAGSGGSGSMRGFRAIASTNQSVTSNVLTTVTLGTEEFDTENAFASNVFTVPAELDGQYMMFTGGVRFTADQTAELYITRNVGEVDVEFVTHSSVSDSGGSSVSVGPIQVSTGQTFELQVFDGNGATIDSADSRTFFSGFVIETASGSGGTPSAPVVPVVRGQDVSHYASASSSAVNFPAGSLEGDTAILFVGAAWAVTTPSGWVPLDNQIGSDWQGGVFAKVLTAADITAGSVTVNFGGAFEHVIGIVVLEGRVSLRDQIAAVRQGTGSASRSQTEYDIRENDLVLMWASNRGSNSVNTFDQGTELDSGSGTNASATIFSATAEGGPDTFTASYGTPGSGLYQAVLVCRPATGASASGSGTSTPKIAKAVFTTDYNAPSSDNVVPLDSAEFDTGGFFSAGTNRLTIPADATYEYVALTANVTARELQSSNADYIVRIKKNGSTIISTVMDNQFWGPPPVHTGPVAVVPEDYFELELWCTETWEIDTTVSFFSIEALEVGSGSSGTMTGAEIVSAIDTELGGTDWQSGGGGAFAGFHVWKGDGTTQNLSSIGEVTWETERFDTEDAFSGNRFTVPASLDGSYMVFGASITFTSGGVCGVLIERSTDGGSTWENLTQQAGGETALGVSSQVLVVSTGDIFRVRAYGGTTTASEARNYFSGYVVSSGSGGSIPVQDDATEIVAAPTALNFTGAGVTVTDNGGVADINIPGGGSTGSATSLNYQGQSFASSDAGASLSVPRPSGATDTSTIFMMIVIEDGVTPTTLPPAGWTELYYDQGAPPPGFPNIGATGGVWVGYGTMPNSTLSLNISGTNGVVVACAAFENAPSNVDLVWQSGFDNDPTSFSYGVPQGGEFVLLSGSDGGSQNHNWDSSLGVPTGATNGQYYGFADGAVTGRGAFVAHVFHSGNTFNVVQTPDPTSATEAGFVVGIALDTTQYAIYEGGISTNNVTIESFPPITITEKTANYDIANSDLQGNQYIEANHSTAMTITVPTNLTGTEPVTIERTGLGTVTFVAGSGVTINSRNGLLDIGGQYGAATLIPKGSNVYTLIGDLA